MVWRDSKHGMVRARPGDGPEGWLRGTGMLPCHYAVQVRDGGGVGDVCRDVTRAAVRQRGQTWPRPAGFALCPLRRLTTSPGETWPRARCPLRRGHARCAGPRPLFASCGLKLAAVVVRLLICTFEVRVTQP